MKTIRGKLFEKIELKNAYEHQKVILRTLQKLNEKILQQEFQRFIRSELSQRTNLTYRIEGVLRLINGKNSYAIDNTMKVLEKEMNKALVILGYNVTENVVFLYRAMTAHASNLLKHAAISISGRLPEFKTILQRCVLEDMLMTRKLQAFEKASLSISPLELEAA